jgi:HEPN domain-containing protein
MAEWIEFIEEVDSREWPTFYKRAEENREAMLEALDKSRYFVAGSCASLCAIAVCDAVLVKRKGYRTRIDRRRVLDAMERAFGERQGFRGMLEALAAVIEAKSTFQYDWEEVSKEEAEKAAADAEKVFDYVVRELRLLED